MFKQNQHLYRLNGLISDKGRQYAVRNQYRANKNECYHNSGVANGASSGWTQSILATSKRLHRKLKHRKTSCNAFDVAYFLTCCYNDSNIPILPFHVSSDLLKAVEVADDPGVFLSETIAYRVPSMVTETKAYRNGEQYPVCPRCRITLDREYMNYCDRCGQRLDWQQY